MCRICEPPCNITRYYVMIVHCMISVLFSVYKLAYFGIQLTNTVSVFRLESSPVVTRFANFHIGDPGLPRHATSCHGYAPEGWLWPRCGPLGYGRSGFEPSWPPAAVVGRPCLRRPSSFGPRPVGRRPSGFGRSLYDDAERINAVAIKLPE